MIINPDKLKKARGKRPRSAVAKELGITRQQIRNYEIGASEPPLAMLSKLLFLYGKNFEDVVNEKIFAKSLN